MKFIKKFEEWSPPIIILEVDKYLTIYENFLNELIFKFKGREFALTTGVAKILGTEYKNNQELSNIKIKVKPQGRTLNNNATRKSVSKIFLKSLGFDDNYIENNYKHFSYKISFREVANNSSTVGEFIDNMKELRSEFELENNIKKYNV